MQNHRVSGSRATAVRRCAHQWPVPSLAKPRPRTRPSGARRFMPSGSHREVATEPGSTGPHHRRGNHGTTTASSGGALDAVASDPHQSTEALAEISEERVENGN